MKTLLLVVLCLPALLRAQTMHNTNFENWYIVNYNVLANWKTSNEITMPQFGAPNATRINPGVTNSSLKLATIAIGLDTMIGYITNAVDLTSGAGGMPYSQRPTGLQGDFRYNIAPNDTARILLSFKKSGVVFATDMISIWGTQQSFAQKNFPLPVMTASGLTPDSVVITITSGDFLHSPAAGSYVELDNLVFTGTGVTQGFNGDFDNWLQKLFVDLYDWAPSGAVFQTNDAFCGKYAAMLTSKNDGVVLEPASIQQTFIPSKAIDTLIGWYKYSSQTPDSAIVQINMINSSGPAVTNTQYLATVANYTQFKIPLAGATISTLKATIVIRSSPWSPAMCDGSTLYIDSLVIKRQAVGVKDAATTTNVLIYPNPAEDVLKISIDKAAVEVEVTLYNSVGAKVYTGSPAIQNGEAALSIGELSAGIYIYELTVGETIYKGRFIKE